MQKLPERPAAPGSLAYFKGTPTEKERALLEKAIRVAEKKLGGTGKSARPWICCCFPRDGLGCYIAHRPGHPIVLTAKSAVDLAEKIAKEFSGAETPRR